MKTALFLFDYTGIMAMPWAEAGYSCLCIDSQHPKGNTPSKVHKNIIFVGLEINVDMPIFQIRKLTSHIPDFIFGFPPCTDLAVSGAAHFKKKAAVNPNFQKDAIALCRTVETLGNHFDRPWALENPVSVLATQWRKPNFYFHPYEFGGYLPEDDKHPFYPEYLPPRDCYSKKTGIWHNDKFIVPTKLPVELMTKTGEYSAMYSKLGGKSIRTKNIRSATPRGFANSVFEANKLVD